MDEETSEPQAAQAGWRERRIRQRIDLGVDAVLHLVENRAQFPGRLENLSLTGALLIANDPAPRAGRQIIELAFRLQGQNFRLMGIVKWADGHRMGIHFGRMSGSREEALSAALSNESASAADPEQAAIRWTEGVSDASIEAVEPAPAPGEADHIIWRERRSYPRHVVQMPAAIYLVNSAIKFNGTVANLGVGGCRIHVDQPLKVGIYTRIEAGFYHLGMPFRVAGVIQVLHSPHEVGIKFLDVSPRIAAKLADLMQELEAE